MSKGSHHRNISCSNTDRQRMLFHPEHPELIQDLIGEKE